MLDKHQLEFRGIPNHPGYMADSGGGIWTCWRVQGAGYGRKCKQVMGTEWKKLKGDPRKCDGRLRYTLRREDGTYRKVYGSNLVLEAFIGPRPSGMECCHRDGNCRNDAISNLRWGTSTSNKADMVSHGTRLKGEQINTCKLTE